MNQVNQLAGAIFERYGAVKRARGCFLYTAKGVRLTDLYQEGGRAILGWGGGSAFTVLKNVLNRGATGSFYTDFAPRADNPHKSQVARAVSALLKSERTVYAFTNKQAALKAALQCAPQSTSVYKPWTHGVDFSTVEAVIIEPPLPLPPSYWLVAVRAQNERLSLFSLESAPISAPLCAAFTRAIYNLIAALHEREEKHFFLYDTILTKYWTRKGPYLFPKVPAEQYADFVQHCLEQEIVISPVYEQPSIVPFGADNGVFRKLEKHPFALDAQESAQ